MVGGGGGRRTAMFSDRTLKAFSCVEPPNARVELLEGNAIQLDVVPVQRLDLSDKLRVHMTQGGRREALVRRVDAPPAGHQQATSSEWGKERARERLRRKHAREGSGVSKGCDVGERPPTTPS